MLCFLSVFVFGSPSLIEAMASFACNPPISSFHRYLPIEAVKGKRKQSSVHKKPNISIPLDGGNIRDSVKIQSADVTQLSLKTDVDNTQRKDNTLDSIDSLSPITREDILGASISTCAAIAVSGVCIQQATHWAAESGWSVSDNDIEAWQLGVLFGLVVSVSIARQILIEVWPEFAESSDVANQQVLRPLGLGDYVVAAVLPGLSEELLFRGALLPLFGLDWKGVTISGVIFGLLHLTGGRRTAFAIWASFVGILYGAGCVATHSVLIPMAAHSANNLIGALFWKLKQQNIMDKD